MKLRHQHTNRTIWCEGCSTRSVLPLGVAGCIILAITVVSVTIGHTITIRVGHEQLRHSSDLINVGGHNRRRMQGLHHEQCMTQPCRCAPCNQVERTPLSTMRPAFTTDVGSNHTGTPSAPAAFATPPMVAALGLPSITTAGVELSTALEGNKCEQQSLRAAEHQPILHGLFNRDLIEAVHVSDRSHQVAIVPEHSNVGCRTPRRGHADVLAPLPHNAQGEHGSTATAAYNVQSAMRSSDPRCLAPHPPPALTQHAVTATHKRCTKHRHTVTS